MTKHPHLQDIAPANGDAFSLYKPQYRNSFAFFSILCAALLHGVGVLLLLSIYAGANGSGGSTGNGLVASTYLDLVSEAGVDSKAQVAPQKDPEAVPIPALEEPPKIAAKAIQSKRRSPISPATGIEQSTNGRTVGSATQAGNGGTGAGKAGKDFIFSLGMVDQKPRLIRKVDVVYPDIARRRGLNGEVVVRFALSARGEIFDAHVLEATPPATFDVAALTAVKKWQFSPAIKDGKAVAVWVDVPVLFLLK